MPEARANYLGEFPVDAAHEVHSWTPTQWAMRYIEAYGQTDGSHHKQWVLDQVARILKGTPVIVKMAKWKNFNNTGEPGGELRFTTGEPSQEYLDWVEEMLGDTDEDGEREYGYDEGIAP